ncbi:hypothetical protein GGS23DRAFT_13049 [Durotheca rogersii]|uniref:uncharacterized protein n=1 Tax=Durotheca rogersii TaxID=419775 RepID=UPI00221F8531|nr:uncharacterized protein GGS23DRAFT_13049 [Durotheca rogersii]KAI5868129.1 hypothetical protein GGS23DRAFT_13049 [Durotheca rogersii]
MGWLADQPFVYPYLQPTQPCRTWTHSQSAPWPFLFFSSPNPSCSAHFFSLLVHFRVPTPLHPPSSSPPSARTRAPTRQSRHLDCIRRRRGKARGVRRPELPPPLVANCAGVCHIVGIHDIQKAEQVDRQVGGQVGQPSAVSPSHRRGVGEKERGVEEEERGGQLWWPSTAIHVRPIPSVSLPFASPLAVCAHVQSHNHTTTARAHAHARTRIGAVAECGRRDKGAGGEEKSCDGGIRGPYLAALHGGAVRTWLTRSSSLHTYTDALEDRASRVD